ncbi:MAG: hypothetical protein QOE53_2563, partial [Pseudonocardiales bacterium]|nr:hypothetical protein [Pseudonocardiales bacterium]
AAWSLAQPGASRSLEPRAAWSLAQPGASRSLEQKSSTLRTAVFIISYAPPSNGTLTPNWVTEASFNSDRGGVAPEAATLR